MLGSESEFKQLYGVMKDFKTAFEDRQKEMQRQIDAIDMDHRERQVHPASLGSIAAPMP